MLAETDLTEQKVTTEQTEIGQLNDEDIDKQNRSQLQNIFFFFL